MAHLFERNTDAIGCGKYYVNFRPIKVTDPKIVIQFLCVFLMPDKILQREGAAIRTYQSSASRLNRKNHIGNRQHKQTRKLKWDIPGLFFFVSVVSSYESLGAAIVQWIRLRLPSCSPVLNPKHTINAFSIYGLLSLRKDENKLKEAGIGRF